MTRNLENIDWDDSSFQTEVSANIVDIRKEICNQCPHLSKIKMCTQCGCFMPMKIRLTGFGVKCPLNKW